MYLANNVRGKGGDPRTKGVGVVTRSRKRRIGEISGGKTSEKEVCWKQKFINYNSFIPCFKWQRIQWVHRVVDPGAVPSVASLWRRQGVCRSQNLSHTGEMCSRYDQVWSLWLVLQGDWGLPECMWSLEILNICGNNLLGEYIPFLFRRTITWTSSRVSASGSTPESTRRPPEMMYKFIK